MTSGDLQQPTATLYNSHTRKFTPHPLFATPIHDSTKLPPTKQPLFSLYATAFRPSNQKQPHHLTTPPYHLNLSLYHSFATSSSTPFITLLTFLTSSQKLAQTPFRLHLFINTTRPTSSTLLNTCPRLNIHLIHFQPTPELTCTIHQPIQTLSHRHKPTQPLNTVQDNLFPTWPTPVRPICQTQPVKPDPHHPAIHISFFSTSWPTHLTIPQPTPSHTTNQ